jgi:diadenosine tetraphosphatase ApaH/serine/threonine PP2A family protein phosphatase
MEDAIFNFNFFRTKFCFIGHTHVPSIIVMEKPGRQIAVLKPRNFNFSLDFPDTARFIINVGSVGQPRDKNPKACYAVYDDEKKMITFNYIPYDIALFQRKMRAAGMPDFLIQRVADGI